ncbi:mechanosensitive ion channel [Demetria terragena]|uniref:mechanosensitive ion channel n=1 Tax=Demetria terragena TaxID=63959 RepID=UPI00035E5378|nr:mechanosensitive ion channel [Demetria terragena]
MRAEPFWENFDWASTLQQVIAATVILLITWILAKVVKSVFAKLVDKVGFLQKAGSDGQSLGTSLGAIAALLIWMFGLIAVLSVFKLTAVLTPIQSMLDGVANFLPNLIGAGLVFVVGALLAKVVRDLLRTALGTVPFDKWLQKGNKAASAVEHEARGQQATEQSSSVGGQYAAAAEQSPGAKIANLIATVAYALIMIVVAISALQILGIKSISEPAESMLTMMFEALPAIIAAAIMLAIGAVIAKFAADILAEVLSSLNIDGSLQKMEVLPEGKSAVPGVVKAIQVAIMLFFGVMAAQSLGFPQITRFLTEVLSLGGRVLFGAAIIGAGVFIANLLAKLVGADSPAGVIVKYGTVVLFAAMGLKYMGIADSIIELGFGALVVGGALAAALAFGLGGRDAAAKQLERLGDKTTNKSDSNS